MRRAAPTASATPALAAPRLTPQQWNLLALALLVLACIPFWLSLDVPFIWDDLIYITDNPDVLAGLSPRSIAAAFTSARGALWIPLTWLSFMLDVSLFGKSPWAFHVTNILLHTANALLAYAFLKSATGNPTRSLIAALLWAIHPLRVESVAWITERKDVLSMFFGLLTMLAYLQYSRVNPPRRLRWYLATAALFALSLMAKPMTVTLPCVLFLLDLWPLNRWSTSQPSARLRLGLEKLPLLALAIAISLATVLIPSAQTLLVTGNQRTLPVRLGTALHAYLYTLRDNFYFEQLSFFYPLRPINSAETVLSICVLGALTAAALWAFFRRPALGKPALVGWLWYLGALLPTSGIVQMGSQARADRFTYFPALGLALALVWLPPDALFRPRIAKIAATLVTAGLALALCFISISQLALWRDPFRLYTFSAQRTDPNWMMEFMAGRAAQDSTDPAIAATAPAWYLKSIQSYPNYPLSHFNLGTLLLDAGHPAEALNEFRTAAALDPANPAIPQAIAVAESRLAQQPPPR